MHFFLAQTCGALGRRPLDEGSPLHCRRPLSAPEPKNVCSKLDWPPKKTQNLVSVSPQNVVLAAVVGCAGTLLLQASRCSSAYYSQGKIDRSRDHR